MGQMKTKTLLIVRGMALRIAATGDRDTDWYGRDCTYPSSGWNASAAHGVGTISRQHAPRYMGVL